MKHCVEQIRRKRTRCVFFGTGFKSGKTNHTPKFEIWKLTVQLDKRCNCTFGFAFDKLQTTMSLWCSWNERISYQPIPKCCAAGWPVLFGMVQHGSTTLSYAEWHRSRPSSPHPTSHTKDGEFFQAIHLSPKNGQKNGVSVWLCYSSGLTSRCAVCVQIGPAQGGRRKFPGLRSVTLQDPKRRFAYRSCGRLPCSFPGLLTSCGKLWTLPTTSHLLSTLFNDLHFYAHLLDSPQLSFHLALLLSMHSFQLVLAHLTSAPPVHFFSASRSDTVANFLVQANRIAFPFDHGFSIRLCYHSRVMCYHSILLDCWLLPVGATFMHVWAAARSQPDRVCLGLGQTCRLNMPGRQEWSFYAQKLSHKEAFAHGKLLHRGTCTERIGFTQRSVYTEKVLHRESFHTKEPLDKDSFKPSNVLHTEAFTQSSSYTEKLLHRASLYTERLLHRDAFTQITWYPEKLLQRKLCHREAVTQR